jgi:hypothetical protein
MAVAGSDTAPTSIPFMMVRLFMSGTGLPAFAAAALHAKARGRPEAALAGGMIDMVWTGNIQKSAWQSVYTS